MSENVDLNEYAKRIYEQNKAVGWWDDPNRCLFECLQLISTEVAEATEGERKDLMDDHLPHRKMGEVELADALIRTLDLGGRIGAKYAPRHTLTGEELDGIRKMSVGKRHLAINTQIVELVDTVEEGSGRTNRDYSELVDVILFVAASFGYDVMAAMREKLEYNKQRADHKRENRAKAHGKKF